MLKTMVIFELFFMLSKVAKLGTNLVRLMDTDVDIYYTTMF